MKLLEIGRVNQVPVIQINKVKLPKRKFSRELMGV